MGKRLETVDPTEWSKCIRAPLSVVNTLHRASYIMSMNPWQRKIKQTRHVTIFTDASTTGGAWVKLGVGGEVDEFSWWPWGLKWNPKDMFHLELLTVLQAIVDFVKSPAFTNIHSSSLGDGVALRIFTDNSGVVGVLM